MLFTRSFLSWGSTGALRSCLLILSAMPPVSAGQTHLTWCRTSSVYHNSGTLVIFPAKVCCHWQVSPVQARLFSILKTSSSREAVQTSSWYMHHIDPRRIFTHLYCEFHLPQGMKNIFCILHTNVVSWQIKWRSAHFLKCLRFSSPSPQREDTGCLYAHYSELLALLPLSPPPALCCFL